VIFHSYVSLPEGTRCLMFRSKAIFSKRWWSPLMWLFHTWLHKEFHKNPIGHQEPGCPKTCRSNTTIIPRGERDRNKSTPFNDHSINQKPTANQFNFTSAGWVGLSQSHLLSTSPGPVAKPFVHKPGPHPEHFHRWWEKHHPQTHRIHGAGIYATFGVYWW